MALYYLDCTVPPIITVPSVAFTITPLTAARAFMTKTDAICSFSGRFVAVCITPSVLRTASIQPAISTIIVAHIEMINQCDHGYGASDRAIWADRSTLMLDVPPRSQPLAQPSLVAYTI